jgi:hypothetical protein
VEPRVLTSLLFSSLLPLRLVVSGAHAFHVFARSHDSSDRRTGNAAWNLSIPSKTMLLPSRLPVADLSSSALSSFLLSLLLFLLFVAQSTLTFPSNFVG